MNSNTATIIATAAIVCTLTVMIGIFEITQEKEMIKHCSYNIMVSPPDRIDNMMAYCGIVKGSDYYKEVVSDV